MDCQPGSSSAPALPRIDDGDGKGAHLLSVEHTSSPVDLDLLNDTLRLPYRERLAILLNEFGTGLAGRGEDLNEVIHRANPALRETDKVLKILASQNRTLARLASDSDRVLAPLAREKEHFADFIVQANTTAEASAERRGDLQRSIELLPGFLRELRPLMADLEDFTDQATPVFTDLNTAAPGPGQADQGAGGARGRVAGLLPEPRRRARAGPPRADRLAPADPGPRQAGPPGGAGGGEPRRAHAEPREDRARSSGWPTSSTPVPSPRTGSTAWATTCARC